MSELVPIDDDEAKPLSPEVDAFLRAANIVDAINANLPPGSKPLAHIPKDISLRQAHRNIANDAFNTVFLLRGGAPGLAAWAEQKPTEFYSLWARLAQSEAAGAQTATTVIVQTQIPRSPLDDVSVHPSGGTFVDAELDGIDEAI